MNFLKTSLVIYVLIICTSLFSIPALAGQYRLELMLELEKIDGQQANHNWLEPLIHPTNKNKLFIANENGHIYLAETHAQPSSNSLLKMVHDPSLVALTAMTLHPNFSRTGEDGHGALFTAHTTSFATKSIGNRLIVDNTNISFAFETVITAWQYDFDKSIIRPDSHREVIRIPIDKPNAAIQAMKFDPFQKPWNTDYGNLYLSLPVLDTLKHIPLYSGAILKISPLQFGVRDYTIPSTNPFLNTPEFNQEIAIIGLGNIRGFFWTRSDSASIFIQHLQADQHKISKANLGDDFTQPNNTSLLWQAPQFTSAILLYQSRTIQHLKNKMIFFKRSNEQWHLASHDFSLTNKSPPDLESIINQDIIPSTAKVSLRQDTKGAIILLDHQLNKLYSLISETPLATNAETKAAQISNQEISGSKLILILLIGITGVSIFIYLKPRPKASKRSKLEASRFTLKYKPSTQSILLFKTKNNEIFKDLAMSNLKHCDLILNDNIITTIDTQAENAMSNHKADNIQKQFDQEHFKKLVGEQVRSIGVILTDHEDLYTACIYFRKGNNRITGAKYLEAVELCINLCWDISKVINSKNTTERFIPTPPTTQNIQTKKAAPLTKRQQPTINTAPTSPPDNSLSENNEVVADLDKLVNLYKQSYLTEAEFNLAKSKLLK